MMQQDPEKKEMYIQMILTDYIDLYVVHCKLYFMRLYQSLLLGSQNLVIQQVPQEKRSTKYILLNILIHGLLVSKCSL